MAVIRDQSDVVLDWLLADLSVNDVAKLFDVHPSTVRRWVRNGVPASRAEQITQKYGKRTSLDAINAAFADAKSCTAAKIGGFPDERVHENKDGSVDAQLTVYDYPRGMAPTHLVDVLAECCRALENTFNSFVQVGMRWGATGDNPVPDSGDRRYRGLAEGSTYYYHAGDLGRTFVRARDIALNVGRKSRRTKIETVFVRLHWNPDGVAPKDWNPKKLVYRVYKRKTRKGREG